MMFELALVKPGEQPLKKKRLAAPGIYFTVELTWDSAHDLDLFAMLAKNDGHGARLSSLGQVLSVYNMHPSSERSRSFATDCGSLRHSGAPRPGAGKTLVETITLEGNKVPAGLNEVLIFASINEASKNQRVTFKDVRNAVITIKNEAARKICSYRLNRKFGHYNLFQFGSFIKEETDWQFVAVAQGAIGNINTVLKLLSLSPTVLEITGSQSRTKPSYSPQETPPVLALVPVVKTTLPVTTENLRLLAAQSAEEVIERAYHLLCELDVQTIGLKEYLKWGQRSQRAHGRLVNKCLMLVQDAVLTETKQDLQQLQELLANIDLQTMLDSGNWFSHLFSSAEKQHEETLERFNHTQAELNDLLEVLRKKKQSLLKVKEQLQTVFQQIENLSCVVEAEEIAARYLIEHWRSTSSSSEEAERHIDALEGRSQSLLHTLVQIRESGTLSVLQLRPVLELIRQAEEIALVAVPAWLSNYVALKSAVETRQPTTAVQVQELQRELEHIRTQLNITPAA